MWESFLSSLGKAKDKLAEFLPKRNVISIDPDGRCFYQVYMNLQVHCEVDVTYFPFDTQHCHILATAWASKKSLLHLVADQPPIDIRPTFSNSQWEPVHCTGSEWEDFWNDYSKVKFIIHLKRRPLFHLTNIVIPMSFLNILTLLVFFVPPEGGERVSAALTTFLSFSLFSVMITDQSPESSKSLSIACRSQYCQNKLMLV